MVRAVSSRSQYILVARAEHLLWVSSSTGNLDDVMIVGTRMRQLFSSDIYHVAG